LIDAFAILVGGGMVAGGLIAAIVALLLPAAALAQAGLQPQWDTRPTQQTARDAALSKCFWDVPLVDRDRCIAAAPSDIPHPPRRIYPMGARK
jgi:hypothetical protein